MTLLTDILEHNRHNKSALSRVDSSGKYRFESYSYGVNRYYRVCAELKAVYYNASPTLAQVFRGEVDGKTLPKTFRTERTCMDAIVKQAKAEGII